MTRYMKKIFIGTRGNMLTIDFYHRIVSQRSIECSLAIVFRTGDSRKPYLKLALEDGYLAQPVRANELLH